MEIQGGQTASVAYKLLHAEEWKEWQGTRVFRGSAVDLNDGYIHLSTASQAAETFDKYFKGREDIVLIQVDLDVLRPSVKWEPSRGGELFPHVYAHLPLSAALIVKEDVTPEIMSRIAEEGLS